MITKHNKLAEINPSGVKRVLVFGDLHGDFAALEKGLTLVEDSDIVIFLGDYADRGPYGVEVIEKIDECISRFPEQFIALKGNHEDYVDNGDPLFSPWTLLDDVKRGGDTWDEFFPRFSLFLDKLYLSALFPGYALFVHGGISSLIRSREDLIHPSRKVEEAILWSDPGTMQGEQPNKRGAGCLFGEDISGNVLSSLGVSHLIRSHEPRKAGKGPAVEHHGMVTTISSTNVYEGRAFVLLLDMRSLPETPEKIRSAAVFL